MWAGIVIGVLSIIVLIQALVIYLIYAEKEVETDASPFDYPNGNLEYKDGQWSTKRRLL